MATSSKTTAADRLIRDQKQQEHVKQLWIFLACVIGFLTLANALGNVRSYIRKRSSLPSPQRDTNPDKEKLPTSAVPSSWSRALGALMTGYRVTFFRVPLPIGFGTHLLLSEMTFICIYMAALLIWLLVDTRDLTVMFYEDRAAHLASCQLPLIVALAGKNNIISFLTGISHEKLNVLHRAAARSVLMLLWMHAITRTVAGLPQQFDFTHDWMRAGALGLAAFTLATILSIGPIRQAAFELFLLSHIALILIFLVSGYYHAQQQEFGGYIWPAIMLWAFDRALRGMRILWNNRLWLSSESKYSSATVELVSSDTIRLILPRRFSWMPGQHAYVTLPTVSKLPFEAHPFTIASIPAQPRHQDVDGRGDNDVVFIIRGRNGMTERLRQHVARENRPRISVPALVDGPYGSPPNLLRFSTNILIAGGSGISYTLPLLLSLLRPDGGKSATQRVVFVWMIRDADHLEWISKTLTEALEGAPSTLSVEPRIYVTGSKYPVPALLSTMGSAPPGGCRSGSSKTSTSSGNNSSSEIAIEEKPELPAYSALKVIHGRPSIRKLLHEEISTSSGSVSVDVAGPTSLSDSVRRALTSDAASPRAALKGMPLVTLHVERFGM